METTKEIAEIHQKYNTKDTELFMKWYSEDEVNKIIAIHRSEVYDEMNKALTEYQQKVKESIEEVCHSLGEPDYNGENHIKGIDGMHWKELAEKFETRLNIK